MSFRSSNYFVPKRNKYKNYTVKNKDGTFDSAKEYYHWIALKDMEKHGEIQNLRKQVPYILIPAQYEEDRIGPRGGVKKGKCIEKSCSYIADFVFEKDGKTVVQDTKGFRTPEYVIKRKLMLLNYGIRIEEI